MQTRRQAKFTSLKQDKKNVSDFDSSKSKYVCLGFAFGESDRIRLNALQIYYNKPSSVEVEVIAVNESTEKLEVVSKKHDYLYKHISTGFNNATGIAKAIDSNTTVVMLDYFWLQEGYYKLSYRYGLQWLVKGGQLEYLFTKTNVQLVILPLDTGADLYNSILKHQKEAASKFCHCAIISRSEAKKYHPLVRSDQAVNNDIPKDRATCNYHLEKYTMSEDKAFAVFYPIDQQIDSMYWRLF